MKVGLIYVVVGVIEDIVVIVIVRVCREGYDVGNSFV